MPPGATGFAPCWNIQTRTAAGTSNYAFVVIMPKGDFIGEFELYVMLAIVHLADDAYGIRIRQEIERRTGRDVVIGAVYATLGRLRDKKLVDFTLSSPEPVQGGRARKHYLLTP